MITISITTLNDFSFQSSAQLGAEILYMGNNVGETMSTVSAFVHTVRRYLIPGACCNEGKGSVWPLARHQDWDEACVKPRQGVQRAAPPPPPRHRQYFILVSLRTKSRQHCSSRSSATYLAYHTYLVPKLPPADCPLQTAPASPLPQTPLPCLPALSFAAAPTAPNNPNRCNRFNQPQGEHFDDDEGYGDDFGDGGDDGPTF